MKLILIDWNDEKHDFDIGELDDIMTIDICVLSGDEIAQVLYKDGCEETFDSGFMRIADFFDCIYNIYDSTEETNLIFAERFLKRKTSYDMLEAANESDT